MRALVTVVFVKQGGESWGIPPETKLIESSTEESFVTALQLFLMDQAKNGRIASHAVTLLPAKS